MVAYRRSGMMQGIANKTVIGSGSAVSIGAEISRLSRPMARCSFCRTKAYGSIACRRDGPDRPVWKSRPDARSRCSCRGALPFSGARVKYRTARLRATMMNMCSRTAPLIIPRPPPRCFWRAFNDGRSSRSIIGQVPHVGAATRMSAIGDFAALRRHRLGLTWVDLRTEFNQIASTAGLSKEALRGSRAVRPS